MPRHPAPEGSLGRRLTPALRGAAVRLGQPARSALGLDRLLVFSLAAAGASMLAAMLAGRAILAGHDGHTPLHLEPIANPDIGVAWSDLMHGVGATRAHALTGLLDIIAIVTAGAVLVGLITLAALSWTRASGRREEIAIRRAVGASRRHLSGSALLEGLAIGLPSLAFGLASGWLLARWLVSSWPGPGSAAQVDPLVPGAALLLATCAGALLVLRHARSRRVDAVAPGGLGLVPQVIQMACTLAVLGAAISLSRQATLLLQAGPSIAEAERYRVDATALEPGLRSERLASLLGDLDADRTVVAAAVGTPGLELGLGAVDWIQTDCGQCREAGIILQWHNLKAAHHVISPDTFVVLRMPLLAGRSFTRNDDWEAPRVVVVNRHLALRHFQYGEAVGRTLTLGTWRNRVTYTVVGIVDDRQAPSLGSGDQPREALYLSALQHPPASGVLLVQRRTAQAGPIAAPGIALARDQGLAALRRHEASLLSWFATALRLEGLLALVAAVAGVFVAMRTWSESLQGELAVRRAVGASRRRVLARLTMLVLLAVSAGAVAARVLVAPVVEQLLGTLLRDPGHAVLVSWAPMLVLTCAALVGALPPALAATRESPARALA